MNTNLHRCDWCVGNDLYEHYHDEEWGVPLFDDRKLFEFLILEGAQAGLSWITVLKKRDGYREAFANFDPVEIAGFDESRCEQLRSNEGIIRNQLKIKSAVTNARAYLKIIESGASFSDYIWQFTDGKTIQNCWKTLTEVPAETQESRRMSKQLKQDGFTFVGPTICYAFMQATGMVNDHLTSCFRYNELKQLSS